MIFVKDGQRIATENFVSGKVYNILFKNDVNTNMMCTSIGSDCVIFQGQAPLGLFTLTIQNADTVDTIEEAQTGTTNYNNLINKPSINSVDLIGNKTSAELLIREVPTITSSDYDKVLTANNDGTYNWQSIPQGTMDYTDLTNKPQINSVELSGNKSLTDLGIQEELSSSQLDAVNSGITSADVTQIGTNENNILSVQGKVKAHSEGGTDYDVINGIRVYVSATQPTGDIPVGSLWIGG